MEELINKSGGAGLGGMEDYADTEEGRAEAF